jgi:hypothetical protein
MINGKCKIERQDIEIVSGQKGKEGIAGRNMCLLSP